MIRQELTAWDAVEKALAQGPGKEQRQIGAVDIRGNAYGFTGGECPEHAGRSWKRLRSLWQHPRRSVGCRGYGQDF